MAGRPKAQQALLTADQRVDAARKLPKLFLGEVEAMSELSDICKAAGLHELFLTVMKK